MSKLKLICVLLGSILIVLNSAFTTKLPPAVKLYGWEQGVTTIVHNMKESITGGSFVDFTQFRNLVRLESVTETCVVASGTFCSAQFSATEETDNVRFTLDPDRIHITIRVRKSLISNLNYVSIPPPDNRMLTY